MGQTWAVLNKLHDVQHPCYYEIQKCSFIALHSIFWSFGREMWNSWNGISIKVELSLNVDFFFSSHNNSNEWNLIVTIIFLWYSCNLSMGCNGPTMGLVHDLWELATDFYNMIAFPTPWTRIKRGSGCSMEPTQTKPVQISIVHIIGHVTHQLWIEVHLNHNWPVVWCCNLGGAKLGPTWPHLTKVKLSLGLFRSGSPRLGSGFVNPNLTLVPNLSVWTNHRVRWTHLVIIKLTLTTHLWGSLLWKYVRRFLILLFFPGYYCRI